MSGLILCGRTSEVPLYVKNLNINIYSLEELCYYLRNNIYEIDGDFFDEKLMDFLRDGLGLTKLADNLKNKNRFGESYMSMAKAVIDSSYYYNSSEKQEIFSLFDELSKMTFTERVKTRADIMLQKGKCESALQDYKAIISKKYPADNLEMVANVWNNMGVAYTKMFMYRDAFSCFKLAYDMDKKSEYLDNYICCAIFAKEYSREGDELIKEAKRQYGVDDVTLERYKKAIELARADSMEKPESVEMLKKLEYSEEKDLVGYGNDLMDIIGRWKQDYREQIQV